MKLMALHGCLGFGNIDRKLRPYAILASALLFSVSVLEGKPRHAKNQADDLQDQIEVVAHLPLTGGMVSKFLTTQHYRREYLYAEHEPGKAVTLIDITKVDAPSVLADVSYPNNGTANLVAVTGNAVLATTADTGAGASATPQTFRIMSFADPLHPTVKQEFASVTAMSRDDKRGLIFLANSDGVWILQQRYAMDPEFVKEWEHMMLDAR